MNRAFTLNDEKDTHHERSVHATLAKLRAALHVVQPHEAIGRTQ
jgi:hypothetical protein